MRLRVTATMRRQLAGLRDERGQVRKGGVMLVPPILSCDEWEALAAPMQDRLIAASHEDRELRAKLNPAPPIIGKDPADRTGAYRNQMIIMPVPQYPGAENR